MHDYLIEMLECPACHGALWWEITTRDDGRINEGEARCPACDGVYPIKERIGVFLTPDLPRHDLWEQTESGLVRYLRDHRELERQLMDAPLEALNSADQFFRAMVLEERGDYNAARPLPLRTPVMAGQNRLPKASCWKALQSMGCRLPVPHWSGASS